MSTKSPSFLDRILSRKKSRARDTGWGVEFAGFVLIVLGFAFFASILTYDQADPTFWYDYEKGNEYQARNMFRMVGATLALPFFMLTFGYGALIFPILLIMAGWALVFREDMTRLLPISLLMLGWAWLLSILLAIPKSVATGGFTNDYFPSGAMGGLVTDKVMLYGGVFSIVIVTMLLFFLMLMLSTRFRISMLPLYVSTKMSGVVSWFRNIWNGLRKSLSAIPWFAEKPASAEAAASAKRSGKKAPPVVEEHSIGEPVQTVPDYEPPLEEIPPAPAPIAPEMPMGEPTQSTRLNYPAEAPSVPEAAVTPPMDTGIGVDEIAPVPPAMPDEPPEAVPVEVGEQIEADFEAQRKREIEELAREKLLNYDKLVREAMETYELPPTDFLNEDESESKISREELMANADLLENTLAQFGVKAFVKKVIEGPVITLYAVRPAEGVKINQIVNLSDDLALAMRAKGIRMIAPIPGEAAIGIEIPNRRPSTVYFKSIVRSEKFINNSGQLILGMGKTIGGEVFCADLTRMPHLLIAGSTGSGKSVGINTMIASILYRVPPSDVKFVLIDPKKLELSLYQKLKDQYLAVCPDLDEIVVTHPQNAVLILKAVVNEMEERYDKLAGVGVRDIVAYNKKVEKFEATGKNDKNLRRLPYIVVVIDELADLILTASREVEEPITRLAQMARAVGIHLIVATQRPSVDILTGLIKANFPTRIAYQVATRPDSKTILDMYGAEKLIGNGDLLFLPPGTGKPVRLQNPFVSTEEVESMLKHIKKQPKFPPYELKLIRENEVKVPEAAKRMQQDELFDKAREIVIRHQQGSVSLLQRKLKIGYARAGRLMDELEEAKIVGPGQGSKARDVLVSTFTDSDK